MKSAFGFGSDAEFEDDITVDDLPSAKPASLPATTQPKADEVEEEAPLPVDAIFEHVVSVFNQALPDFLRKSVDPAAQRQFLYQTLEGDIRAHVDKLAEAAHRNSQRHWAAENQKQVAQLQRLETQSRELEEKRNQLEQKNLSNERQRRALNEKIHGLETNIRGLEANIEQYQLENKGLINKVKVAGVHEKENQELREQIALLTARLNGQPGAEAAPQQPSNADDIAALEALAADAEAQRASMADQLAAAQAQTEALKQSVQDMEQATRKLAEELEEARTETTIVQESLQERNLAVEALQKQLETERNNAKPMEREAMEARMREIEAEMLQIDEVLRKKDAQLADLRHKLSESQENEARMALSMDDNNRRVVEAEERAAVAAEKHARTERKLQSDIDRLSVELDNLRAEAARSARAAGMVVDQRKRQRQERRQPSESQIPSPIDDILTDTDWVVSPSALKGNRALASDTARPYGNRRRDRNDSSENDSQLSLF